MIDSEDKKKLWDLIGDMKIGMLSTVDDGALRSRPMCLAQKDFDGTLLFFLSSDSAVAEEVSDNCTVNVSFMDTGDNVYVSLSGVGRLISDPEVKKQHTNPMIDTWFPEGVESDGVQLLQIDVDFAQYWESNNGKLMSLLEIGLAKLHHRKPDLGENVKMA